MLDANKINEKLLRYTSCDFNKNLELLTLVKILVEEINKELERIENNNIHNTPIELRKFGG